MVSITDVKPGVVETEVVPADVNICVDITNIPVELTEDVVFVEVVLKVVLSTEGVSIVSSFYRSAAKCSHFWIKVHLRCSSS